MSTRLLSLYAAGILVVLLAALPGRAIEEPPRPPTSALGKIRDLAATVRVRRALQDDRELAALNLGVWVENGVVSVWGPMPSSDLARHALAKLETVKGVIEIRPNFYLDREGRKPSIDLLARPEGVPERIEAAKPEIETGKLPGRSRDPIASAGTGPRLFAPRAVTRAPRPDSSATMVKLPRPMMEMTIVSLAERVKQAQQTESRFRDVRMELRGTVIVLKRGDSAGRDVMDLAQQLRRIQGVSDVVLTD